MLFASDLDNTLIHSYHTAKAGDVCVEVKDNTELSYMSPEAYSLLAEVASKCMFIPITSRSLEQYRRIDLGVKPEYAIVAHGAILLVNGQVDEEWMIETRRQISDQLPKLIECALFFDIRYVDGFFVFAKSKCAPRAVELLQSIVDTNKFKVCAAYDKIFIFPTRLNKGEALKRLKKRLRMETVVCAGDSELDVPMLTVADAAIVPATLRLTHAHQHVIDSEDFALSALSIVYERYMA